MSETKIVDLRNNKIKPRGGQITTVADLRRMICNLPGDMPVIGFCGGTGYFYVEQTRKEKQGFYFHCVGNLRASTKKASIQTIDQLRNILKPMWRRLPVRGVGVGEDAEDIQEFNVLARTEDVLFDRLDKPLEHSWGRRVGTYKTVFVLD